MTGAELARWRERHLFKPWEARFTRAEWRAAMAAKGGGVEVEIVGNWAHVDLQVSAEEMRLPAEEFVDLVEARLAQVRVKLFEAKERVDG